MQAGGIGVQKHSSGGQAQQSACASVRLSWSRYGKHQSRSQLRSNGRRLRSGCHHLP
jgi:hypothetical protein